MSNQTEETELAPELEKVILFRMDKLIHAGFSPDNAELLASAEYVNWHSACDAMTAAKKMGTDEAVVVRMFI